ncbi:uncharacterized protein LOC106881722 [Octopus bimaculoides]|uniref:Uncharacterized protein n=1 Tax=Octopus bimaculoides TaxID=37653 RepID=A0A0L8FR11_OCTBM|nr:uncharacterized protein LOC106881722 [Octopus bimaculoides]XP_014787691.1 uncharacterized protein LOC106881722 [Octopus bimaculoides]|eukprot:XP_014787690.1 PREDICTED: uncharacterized protein LOC106881722 [Octopus bimaculoides]
MNGVCTQSKESLPVIEEVSQLNEPKVDEIEELKEMLKLSQAETGRVLEQLNNLILLIKLSWNGDVEATTHISKIIGRENTLNGRWPDQKSLQVLKNWETITQLLLHKNEKEDGKKIKTKQLEHLQQRYDFFQNTMLDHQQLIRQFGCCKPLKSVSRKSSCNQQQSKDLKQNRMNEVDSKPLTTDINNLVLENLSIQPAPSIKEVPVTNCKNLTNIYRIKLRRPVSAVVPRKQFIKNTNRPKSAVFLGHKQKEKHENNNPYINKKFQNSNSIMVPRTSPVERQVEQKQSFSVKEPNQRTSIAINPYTIVFHAESFISARKPFLNGHLMGKQTHEILEQLENSQVS